MIVGLVGLPCAGCHEVAAFLVAELGFHHIDLKKVSNHVDSAIGPVMAEIMNNWKENYVVTGITDASQVKVMRKRPMFYLIAINAPTMARFQRLHGHTAHASFERFVVEDDEMAFSHGIFAVIKSADDVVHNDGDLCALRGRVRAMDILNPARVRPPWDEYFMSLAELASLRSNCMKRRVGAVVVKDCRVIATGYNGTPRGTINCNQGGCPRCNGVACGGSGLDVCLCLHAEENAIIEAGRARLESSTLFSTVFPCLLCAKKICQSGITELVFSQSYATDKASAALLAQAKIKVRCLAMTVPRHRSLTCHIVGGCTRSRCDKFHVLVPVAAAVLALAAIVMTRMSR